MNKIEYFLNIFDGKIIVTELGFDPGQGYDGFSEFIEEGFVEMGDIPLGYNYSEARQKIYKMFSETVANKLAFELDSLEAHKVWQHQEDNDSGYQEYLES